ncbi:hypothetical protein [Mucilaginibacter sp.]|uniref:hypothetical protein n=1 Tax=Mucilaginibacter sp. TaxID=1882438 RepID=UPI0035BBFF1D
MKTKFTFLIFILLAIFIAGCSKNEFDEKRALEAQKELLTLKYQHEIDLETLKQKGATALQELINTAARNQLRLTDSLTRANAAAVKRQDYSVTVLDVVTNTPIADADVTVSSEGKIFTAKTNAQGSASFTALTLYATSSFLVSKSGYAATQILQQDITKGAAKLWNISTPTNELTGTLYIETDLTNLTPETVGANVLVTATASIPNGAVGNYSVSFPVYTTAGGVYSLKLPAAPNGYTLTFDQISANQKLYVNATEDDAVKTFPNSLPRIANITTYFNVNSFNASVPTMNNALYFKVSADKAGNNLYIPLSPYYYYYNYVLLSAVGNKYQIERLNVSNIYNTNGASIDVNSYTYDANSKVDVELVDITGTVVEKAPLLAGITNLNGKLISTNSPEGGVGYIHLKRDNNGTLLTNAKGSFLKATNYDSFNNLYTLNISNNFNMATNLYMGTSFLLPNKGDKKVVNFYFGSGDSRAKQVY